MSGGLSGNVFHFSPGLIGLDFTLALLMLLLLFSPNGRPVIEGINDRPKLVVMPALFSVSSSFLFLQSS